MVTALPTPVEAIVIANGGVGDYTVPENETDTLAVLS